MTRSLPIDDDVLLPAAMREKARGAVLAGTRALIQEERFDALVALLVASGAVPRENAKGMMIGLADVLDRHQGGHTEYLVQPMELRAESRRLRESAEAM